jgi:hypothetical protein
MTREEFLKAINNLDKKQGNYKQTTLWNAKRQEFLNRAPQRIMDTFEYLLSRGEEVFVYELLSRNNAKKEMSFMTPLYLPKYNLAIWYLPNAKNAIEEKKVKEQLKKYIYVTRPWFYTIVVTPDSTFEYVDAKLKEVGRYYSLTPRKGIKDNIVIRPKKKRERIKVTPKYEMVERK